MLSEKVASLMNDQITKEFYSAYLYLQFANHFAEEGLEGFANWYQIQAQEERDHAMLFVAYMHNNDAKITYGAIDAPTTEHKAHIDVLKAGLAHEQYITASINTIYAAANADNDYRTMQFLDWFIKEQGEEEMNATDLLKRFEMFGSDCRGLYLLNQELSARVYSAPSLVL